MKRIKSVLMGGVVLALASVSTLVVAEGAKHPTEATVRAVHGTATYSIDNGAAMPLRVNQELPENATIMTGPDSRVDLQVNGHSSTVRVTENSKMTLKTMEDLGAGDTETMLNIDNGTVFGSVKKITKDSTYEVETPRGVAGIRGTDWAVQVTQLSNGNYTVTFTSVTGQVFVVANINIAGVNTQVPKTLTDGQSWTPPDTATSADAVPSSVPALADIIAASNAAAAAGGGITVTTGGGNITITYVPPVANGSTVGGNSSSSSQSTVSSD